MADLNDLKNDLKRVENELFARLIVTAEKMALNFKALATNKLNNTGLPGEKYSDNPLPLFFLTGNAKTKYGEEGIRRLAKKRAKTGGGVSYKDLREVENLPTDMVTLNFTGEMLRGWGIIATERQGDNFVSILGGQNKAAEKKLGWQKDRYGNFFVEVVGDDGLKMLEEILGNDLDDFLTSNKLV